jgi:hypothetical protein
MNWNNLILELYNLKKAQDELVALVVQYRDDLRHPVLDDGSVTRRLQRIQKALDTVSDPEE